MSSIPRLDKFKLKTLNGVKGAGPKCALRHFSPLNPLIYIGMVEKANIKVEGFNINGCKLGFQEFSSKLAFESWMISVYGVERERGEKLKRGKT